jgi:hypothetical protein
VSGSLAIYERDNRVYHGDIYCVYDGPKPKAGDYLEVILDHRAGKIRTVCVVVGNPSAIRQGFSAALTTEVCGVKEAPMNNFLNEEIIRFLEPHEIVALKLGGDMEEIVERSEIPF